MPNDGVEQLPHDTERERALEFRPAAVQYAHSRGRGVRAQLREALEARAPIRVLREKISPNWVHGHIIGLSAEFCLIAEVSDSMRFDGFLAIAVGDVSAIEEDPGREFVERALALNEEAVPALPEILLDDWETIAETAAGLGPDERA